MHDKSIGCMEIILGDPGADSGSKGKSKRTEKKNGEELLSFAPCFSACLYFPLIIAPTICPCVSENVRKSDLNWNFKMKMTFIKYFPFCWSEMLRDWELQYSVHHWDGIQFNKWRSLDCALFCCKEHRKRLEHKRTAEVNSDIVVCFSILLERSSCFLSALRQNRAQSRLTLFALWQESVKF